MNYKALAVFYLQEPLSGHPIWSCTQVVNKPDRNSSWIVQQSILAQLQDACWQMDKEDCSCTEQALASTGAHPLSQCCVSEHGALSFLFLPSKLLSKVQLKYYLVHESFLDGPHRFCCPFSASIALFSHPALKHLINLNLWFSHCSQHWFKNRDDDLFIFYILRL